MDPRQLLKVFEQQRKQRPKMIIYKCKNGHLRQVLEGRELTRNRCGKPMELRNAMS